MNTGNTDSDRKKHLLRIVRITIGILFLILGVVGSLLPILQGWVFFLLALITFFPEHPRVERILEKAEPKFPRLVRGMRKLGIGDEAAGDRQRSPGSNEDRVDDIDNSI